MVTVLKHFLTFHEWISFRAQNDRKSCRLYPGHHIGVKTMRWTVSRSFGGGLLTWSLRWTSGVPRRGFRWHQVGIHGPKLPPFPLHIRISLASKLFSGLSKFQRFNPSSWFGPIIDDGFPPAKNIRQDLPPGGFSEISKSGPLTTERLERNSLRIKFCPLKCDSCHFWKSLLTG